MAELVYFFLQPHLILIIASLLALYTGHKLVWKSRILGWLPGGHVERRLVLDMSHERHRIRLNPPKDVYALEFAGPAAGLPGGTGRISRETWMSLRRGDSVEVVTFPPDPTPHLRIDVDVEPRNLAVDYGLLALELFGVGYAIRRILRSRGAAERPPASTAADESPS